VAASFDEGPGVAIASSAGPGESPDAPVSPVGAFEVDPLRAVRGAFVAATAGDWLAGLFALAREEVLHHDAVVALLDELLSGMGVEDFLVALPALRQAFEFFPPREREVIAGRLLARRGLGGSARSLTRSTVAPGVVAAGMRLDERVEDLLHGAGLIGRAQA
jgi:hypothetical protein